MGQCTLQSSLLSFWRRKDKRSVRGRYF